MSAFLHRRVVAVVARLAVPVTLVACVGGAGSVPSGADGYDERSGAREAPGSTREAPVDPADPRPDSEPRIAEGGGSGSPGAEPAPATFACNGTYRCTVVVNGRSSTSTLTLARTNGVCAATNEDGDVTILGADGQLTVDGRTGGSWSASGSGFTIAVETVTGSCVPAS